MLAVRAEAVAVGKDAAETAKAIDDSYPYSERSGWAYKVWLDAHRDIFRQHNLQFRRAKKPPADLLP